MAMGAGKKPRIVAVIMTYNCARLVSKAYEKIPKDLVDDIIITDDGSRDNIEAVVAKLNVPFFRHTPNRGYGGNLKEGIRLASQRGADYIVEVHGDGQFDPGALRLAMPYIQEGHDFILGSRFQNATQALKLGMPVIRYLANRGLSFFDWLVLRLPFTEFHTGFRIYRRTFLERVAWAVNSDDYLFSFQIIAQAAYAQARVAEVPVEADYTTDHTSHSLSGATKYAFQTFAVLGQYLLAKFGLWYTPQFPGQKRHCRGCGAGSLRQIFSLGLVPSVNTFLLPEQKSQEKLYPLDVYWCPQCTLVQLGTVVPPTELFAHYQHVSAASLANVEHLKELAQGLIKRYQIGPETKILEIGSNDGSLLAEFKGQTQQLLGIDPAANLAPVTLQKDIEQLPVFLTEELAHDLGRRFGQHELILALNVVAHTPNVGDLLRAISRLLNDNGTFVMEAVHVLPTMLNGEFDTVYHEHVFCFSLTALVPLFAQAGLTIVDVEEIPTQGGSLRVFAQLATAHAVISERVSRLLTKEDRAGITNWSTYAAIGERVEQFKQNLRAELQALQRKHGRVVGLGAPARGVVILNAVGVDRRLVAEVVDDTSLKQGRLVPGTNIPVLGWDELKASPATAYVLLSWNYKDSMLEKLRTKLGAGLAPAGSVEVLVPFPTIHRVTL